jgi:hypothetical protein
MPSQIFPKYCNPAQNGITLPVSAQLYSKMKESKERAAYGEFLIKSLPKPLNHNKAQQFLYVS